MFHQVRSRSVEPFARAVHLTPERGTRRDRIAMLRGQCTARNRTCRSRSATYDLLMIHRRPAEDRPRERRGVLPNAHCQAQLCEQLQLRIELNPSQMAAESMLVGTALTADIMGVASDHRRGDRAADRPPIADARSALQGARP